MQQASIGLSIILGFVCFEVLGLHTGGLITAGYLALYVEQPYRLVSTLLLAVLIYLAVKLLSRFVILYGSRRFMATVILGLIGTWFIEKTFYYVNVIPQDMRVIGYIIPGLIANDMVKQGMVKTLAMTLLVTVIIRMLLMAGIF